MSKIKKLFWRLLLGLGPAGLLVLAAWTYRLNRQVAGGEIRSPEEEAPGTFVTVHGYKMHALVVGNLENDPAGVPLVLLHGWSVGAGATWFPWAEELAGSRTLIILDMLGLGYSERVTKPIPEFTHRGQARLLVDTLEALGVKKFDLVGRSLGGAIGAEIALDFPERVRKLILMDAYIYGNPLANIFKNLGSLPFGIGRAITWTTLGASPNSIAGRKCARGVDCNIYRISQIKDTVDTLQAWNNTRQDTRVPRDLKFINRPTLIIWGSKDPQALLKHGKLIAGQIPGSRMEIIEGAGHWPFLTDPHKTASLILDFTAAG